MPLHNNQQLSSHRLGGFSEYSTSGLPQKGTDRASMLGRTMEGKPSGARFKNSPLLKDVLLKDEPKMTAPKKLKPIHAHLRLSLQERKQLAKERLRESQKKLPKFTSPGYCEPAQACTGSLSPKTGKHLYTFIPA